MRMKWLAIEIKWDGAPPVSMRPRQAQRAIVRLDPGYVYREGSTERIEPGDLTKQGLRAEWYAATGETAHRLLSLRVALCDEVAAAKETPECLTEETR